MKQIFIFTIFSLLTFVLSPAYAADCAKCADLKKLENEFMSLDYFKQADRDNGSEAALKAEDLLDGYVAAYKRKANPQEFNALLAMLAAAAPYDVESVLAGGIASLISDSPEHKKLYEAFLTTNVEACRKKNLTEYVDSFVCTYSYEKSRKKGQPKENVACIKAFNFGDCLKGIKDSKRDPKASKGTKSNFADDDGAGLSSCLLGACPNKGLSRISNVN